MYYMTLYNMQSCNNDVLLSWHSVVRVLYVYFIATNIAGSIYHVPYIHDIVLAVYYNNVEFVNIH